MADVARRDQAKRKVKVDRTKLIEKLKENKNKHVKEYQMALTGYKAVLLEKIKEAYKKAMERMEKNHKNC